MDDVNQDVSTDIDSADTPVVVMEDTILETLREINERNENTSPEDASSSQQDLSKSESKRRVEQDVKPGESPDSATPADNTDQLPSSWKKEAAEAWAKADPVLKAEVQRREADIHKGIEQYKQAADFAYAIDQTIAPYKQTIQSLGVTPHEAIRELMAADHKLRFGNKQDKEMYFSQLARNYGIDLGSVANTVQNTDPRLYELAQHNQLLEQQIQRNQQSVQQQHEQALNSEIVQFAAEPNHEHFETVKLHMASLLQGGQAKTLQDAYDQAIYANPTTRPAVLQQQVAAAQDEAKRKAQAAKTAAGVNIKSRAALPSTKAVTSMEDTIRETYLRLTGT